MSSYEDRVDELRRLVRAADLSVQKALRQHRDSYGSQLRRLGEVLAYAHVVLAGADGALLSDQAHAELQSNLSAVRDQVEASPANADGWASALLVALSYLPGGTGQDLAQTARKAAQTFQRSASQRLSNLSGTISKARSEAETVAEQVKVQRAELEALIEQRRGEIDAQLTETKEALDAERQRIESTTTEQAETFRGAQEERAEEFKTALVGFEKRLTETLDSSEEKAGQLVGEIKRMEEDSRQLVGAIGVHGSAGRYAQEVEDQKKAGNIWRLVTVGIVVAAAAIAFWAARADEVDDPAFVSKIVIAIALGGLATYTAKQSSRHRGREEAARATQLDLTAFGPFIEPLPTEMQYGERIKMAEKMFGRPLVPDEQAQDGGPSILGSIPRPGESAE